MFKGNHNTTYYASDASSPDNSLAQPWNFLLRFRRTFFPFREHIYPLHALNRPQWPHLFGIYPENIEKNIPVCHQLFPKVGDKEALENQQ